MGSGTWTGTDGEGDLVSKRTAVASFGTTVVSGAALIWADDLSSAVAPGWSSAVPIVQGIATLVMVAPAAVVFRRWWEAYGDVVAGGDEQFDHPKPGDALERSNRETAGADGEEPALDGPQTALGFSVAAVGYVVATFDLLYGWAATAAGAIGAVAFLATVAYALVRLATAKALPVVHTDPVADARGVLTTTGSRVPADIGFVGYLLSLQKSTVTWVGIAVIPPLFRLSFGGIGPVDAPVVGTVPLPWHVYPVTGAVGLYLHYRLDTWLAPPM